MLESMLKGRLSVVCLLLLVAGSYPLRAQHYVGVRGGWGGGNARFEPKEETAMQWGLYSGGISWKFFSDTKFVGAIQADLQYTGKGYVTREFKDSDISYHRTINSFELPFMWQPHFYFFQRKARFFLNLGVNFSYNLNSEQWWESTELGEYDRMKYPMKLARDCRFGYGLCGGAGISILTGRWDITFESRYSFGYSDILRTTTKYAPNPTRSPLDNINFSLGVYYRLGKGGLRSTPTRKMAVRMEEAEARRLLKRQQKEGIVPPPPEDSILERTPDDLIPEGDNRQQSKEPGETPAKKSPESQGIEQHNTAS